MKKGPTRFANRKLMIQRIYLGVCLFFCVTIVSVYTIAWVKGASLESVLVSGAILLSLTFGLCGLLYLLSMYIAKKQGDESTVPERRSSHRTYQLLLLFVFLACDVLGIIMILVKEMFLLGFFLIVLGTLVFYLSTKKRAAATP